MKDGRDGDNTVLKNLIALSKKPEKISAVQGILDSCATEQQQELLQANNYLCARNILSLGQDSEAAIHLKGLVTKLEIWNNILQTNDYYVFKAVAVKGKIGTFKLLFKDLSTQEQIHVLEQNDSFIFRHMLTKYKENSIEITQIIWEYASNLEISNQLFLMLIKHNIFHNLLLNEDSLSYSIRMHAIEQVLNWANEVNQKTEIIAKTWEYHKHFLQQATGKVNCQAIDNKLICLGKKIQLTEENALPVEFIASIAQNKNLPVIEKTISKAKGYTINTPENLNYMFKLLSINSNVLHDINTFSLINKNITYNIEKSHQEPTSVRLQNISSLIYGLPKVLLTYIASFLASPEEMKVAQPIFFVENLKVSGDNSDLLVDTDM